MISRIAIQDLTGSVKSHRLRRISLKKYWKDERKRGSMDLQSVAQRIEQWLIDRLIQHARNPKNAVGCQQCLEYQ